MPRRGATPSPLIRQSRHLPGRRELRLMEIHEAHQRKHPVPVPGHRPHREQVKPA